jgi:PilZ domain
MNCRLRIRRPARPNERYRPAGLSLTCLTGISPIERRSNARYPLGLTARYGKLGQKLLTGVGQAVNVSSGGVLVFSRHELSLGEQVELRIEWPSPLEGWIPLQLVILGKVVRCGALSFAVLFRHHQFRTMRSKVQPIAASRHRESRQCVIIALA